MWSLGSILSPLEGIVCSFVFLMKRRDSGQRAYLGPYRDPIQNTKGIRTAEATVPEMWFDFDTRGVEQWEQGKDIAPGTGSKINRIRVEDG